MTGRGLRTAVSAWPTYASGAMLVLLVAILVVGATEGRRGVVLTSLIALTVAMLPALLERNYSIRLSPRLSLWLTSAVVLHAIGTGGLPGTHGYFYGAYPWWDNLTHTLSASVVAATGYITVRALDEHADTIHIPGRMTFTFVLLFTMAIGVLWEVIEFLVGMAPHLAGRTQTGFTQGTLENTMLDLVFNSAGALVVAIVGHVYLTDTVETVREALSRRGEK